MSFEIFPGRVNHSSRISCRRVTAIRRASALTTCLAVVLIASPANADRVVVLPAEGATEVAVERVDAFEDAVAEAVSSLSHQVATDAHGTIEGQAIPQTANEMRAVAELQNAQWVVLPIVRSANAGGLEATLRVGYAPETRVEELDVEVRDSRRAERLQEILRAMLRPEGLGAAAEELAGEDAAARLLEQNALSQELAEREAQEAAALAEREAAEAARVEAEREAAERARQEEEQARLSAEERERQAREAFASRPRYGQGAQWMVQLGGAVRPLLRSRVSGAIGSVEVRGGRSFENLPGLELRLGLDAVFGKTGGIAIHVGGAYLLTPFRFPLHLGVSLEVGLFQPFLGNRTPSFSTRIAPVVAWRFANQWHLEAAVAEVGYLSANDAVITLGFALRLGTRF